MLRNILTIILFTALAIPTFAQVDTARFSKLRMELDLLVADNPGLEEPVEISVSKASLPEFIRAIGTKNKVNISVSSQVRGEVSNTFNQVTVADVLLFLAKQYNLDFDITGNIIHVLPYEIPPPPPKVIIPRSLLMSYDTSSQKLTMELNQDTLSKVCKELTRLTGKNMVFAPEISNKQLTIYLEEVSFDQAMDKMAFANKLQISKADSGFYLIENLPNPTASATPNSKDRRFRDLRQRSSGGVSIDSNLISINFQDEAIMVILEQVFIALDQQYFLYDQIPGKASLNFQNVALEEILDRLFEGTDYSYRPHKGIYLIGNKDMKGLMESRQVPLLNRSVDKVQEYIPRNLVEELEIKELAELNSLVVSGPYPKVTQFEDFLATIDKPVPVVIIEVIIVDYQRNANISTGIEAGVGEQPAGSSGGGVYPGIDYSLNAQSLNEIIRSFNGFGSLNLGPVTPNFYMNLKLLESNGLLNVRSTPKLSTLNGHEATLSIGNTEYYVVEQVNIQGVQNPIPTTTRNYQSVEANFTLKVKPMVSSADQVTLEIEVEQSDFTSRISPEAPPGNVSRTFSSMVRVKNNELILLGGLEEKSSNDTGSGLPVLSRIPILKWFFSSRSRSDSKSKLNVFIKPVIIY